MAGAAQIESQPLVRPGQPIQIRCENRDAVVVVNPKNQRHEIRRGSDKKFTYQETDQLGIYEYSVVRQLAVLVFEWYVYNRRVFL